MAVLQQVDSKRQITLTPCRKTVDQFINTIENASPICVQGEEAAVLLSLMSTPPWQPIFERDLQCVAQGQDGTPLLTTWISLPVFGEKFCGAGIRLQYPAARNLMERIHASVRQWPSSVELVEVSGYVAAS